MTDVQAFYDDIAEQYHFIFADWEKSVYRQADILEKFLANFGEIAPKTILDCTCGIGTQAIALATKGYYVHGTDLSPREIERAEAYAENFPIIHKPSFDVADLLQNPNQTLQYDIVLSFDNAIAHFHTDEELALAISTMKAQLKAGGLLAISLRDYDTLAQERSPHSGMTIADSADGRRLVFQTWDWSEDAKSYQMEMFFLRQSDNASWQTQSYKSHLRAWQRLEIKPILSKLGFEVIQWHNPDESGFYQPIVSARLPK